MHFKCLAMQKVLHTADRYFSFTAHEAYVKSIYGFIFSIYKLLLIKLL